METTAGKTAPPKRKNGNGSSSPKAVRRAEPVGRVPERLHFSLGARVVGVVNRAIFVAAVDISVARVHLRRAFASSRILDHT